MTIVTLDIVGNMSSPLHGMDPLQPWFLWGTYKQINSHFIFVFSQSQKSRQTLEIENINGIEKLIRYTITRGVLFIRESVFLNESFK